MFRWAQVTEELKQALWELEEEKEMRRCAEEDMNAKANEQDNLKNKLSALMEEREKANEVMLMGKEAESRQSTECRDENQLQTQQVHHHVR